MKRKMNRKAILAVALIVLLLTVAVGTTVAYLVDWTDSITNTFTATELPNEVVENFEGNTKKDVKIKNNGNISAYIRAKVVVTWQDANGKVLKDVPVQGTDYTISYSDGKWSLKGDGFWYYSEPVAGGASTDNLFTDCKPLKKAPVEGYTLHVEVLAQSIQAEPSSVVKTEWGFVPGSSN